jgi:hypothetical protein
MTHDGAAPRPAPQQGGQQQGGSQDRGQQSKPAPEPAAAGAPAGQGSIFSKQDREGAPSGERQATGPGGNGQ